MRNWKERHQDEWRRFDDATSSKVFCSQLFAFLFPESNINWTCAAAVRMRLDDIYKAIQMVIDCVFVLCIRATLIFSFLSLIPDSKSFEQRSRTSSGVVCGITWKPLPELPRGISLFLSSLLPPPLFLPPYSRQPALPLPPVVSSCSRPTYLFGYISKML